MSIEKRIFKGDIVTPKEKATPKESKESWNIHRDMIIKIANLNLGKYKKLCIDLCVDNYNRERIKK